VADVFSATCILFENSPDVIEALEEIFGEFIIDEADNTDAILIVFNTEIHEGEMIGLLEDGGVFKVEADYGG
jgi:hypothetical protein